MSKLLDGLNPSQREAVMHETGPLLIIAGPGSGKTRTVVRSIAYAIENRGVVPGRIVAFTFTRKASAELKKRVSKAVGDIANDVWISTFHSFCGSVSKTDFEKLGIGDSRDFTVKELTLIYKERIRSHIDYIQHHRFDDDEEIHNFISECEVNDISPDAASNHVPYPLNSQMYVEIYKRYKQILENGTDNYTKAQLIANALFRDVPEVKARWQEEFDLIFVDEYQDTDPVQYQIIKALAEKRQDLRVVGDDDQGIYGWRGADIKNILNFEKDFPNAKVISLGQNYRSTKQIVDASRSIIDFSPHRREKNLFTNNADGQKVKHLHCENHEAEAATIARFIRRAIQTGWAANDFAVLCRSTKSQAITFEETFSNLAIPYHVVDDSPDIQTNGVSIMTIHKSKGLEFPNVFIAGVCAGVLPHFNSKEEDWDEELRLLYVAMTRAENWLCLSSYDKDESFSRGPSRFLDFIPRSLVERIDTLDFIPIPSKIKKRVVLGDIEKSQTDSISLPIRVQTVLGIDPGKENVGWSITQKMSDGYTVRQYDTEKPIEQRIEVKINELVRLHSPDAICVEKLEGTTDEWFRYVAGCVAQIRSIADQRGIECHFYSPQDVKYAVTGNRNASKEAVQHAVKKVCNLKKIPEPHHSADAIAVSLCYLRNYLNYSRFQDNARKQEHYNTGCAYLDNGQYYEAIAEFEEAINNASMIDPMYIKAHCGLSRAYLGQDKLVAAEKSAKEALRLDDNYQPAFKLLESIKQKYCEHGRNYFNQDDLVSAEKSAKEALRLDDNYQPAFKLLDAIKQAYYNRGHNHYDNQRYGEAIVAFEETTNKFPSFATAHCGLGRAYLGQDKLVAAEKSAKEALRLDDNYQPALKLLESIKQKYCEHGRNYFNQDDLVSAEKSAKEALRLDDNYQPARELLDAIKQAYYNRGHNHYDNQRYGEAIAAFEETTNKFPSFIKAHCGLGRAYLGQDKLVAAEKSAKEALRLDDNYQLAFKLLESIKQKYCEHGRNYFNQDDLVSAEKSAKEALRLDDNYQPAFKLLDAIKQAYYNRGIVYLNNKQYDEAIAAFKETKDRYTNFTAAYCGIGHAYLRKNNLVDAEISANRALRLEDKYQPAMQILEDIKQIHCEHGRVSLKQNDLVAAEKSAKDALRLDPNYQPTYELLTSIKQKYYKQGLAYIANNEYANAIESLLKARDIDQSDKDVHANLGRAYYWLEDHANAASCCRKVITIDPDNKYGHINLGNSYYRMSEYDEAIKPLQKASDIDPNCIKTLYYLARAYFRQGKLEVARQIVSKVLSIDINHHAANKLLGDIKCVIDFQMTRIPAGEYEMGSKNTKARTRENTVHTVYVNTFYMDIYPVTNALYKKFVDENPKWQKINIPKALHNGNYLKHWDGSNYPSDKGNYPITYVSWYAAAAYAQWFGKRLPTETEWEKAARGGLEGKKYPWGDSIDDTKTNLNRRIGDMTSVGKYPANNYGLYDMTGNVWEWCLDEYNLDSYRSFLCQNPITKAGSTDEIMDNFMNVKTERTLCGGSWRDNAQSACVTARSKFSPELTALNLGFRCVRAATD